eukprot:4576641-Lingulodinium_polyedra.AAC.1
MPDTAQRVLLVREGHRVGRQAESMDAGLPDFHQHVRFVAARISQPCRGGVLPPLRGISIVGILPN